MANKELHSVITINNEDYNITANKVAQTLTVKVGDSETVFDGSEQKSVVINIPTTLPANGGNADTVDNKHASDFILTSQKGTAGGVATLGTDGKVPASQLPSQSSLTLGETSSTAYRGDRGKIAYDHSQVAHAPSNAEKNQNAFSNIAVSGQATVVADSATDTLTLKAGNNITITTNADDDSIIIAATGGGDGGYGYTHPDSGVTPGTYQSVTVNAQGHVTGGSTLITHGTTDPSASTASQYYFKYYD